MRLKPFAELVPSPSITDPVGLAAGSGYVALSLKGQVYGGATAAWTPIEWLACARVLESIVGAVKTWDLVDVIHALPGSLRAALDWRTIYDMAVDRALQGLPDDRVVADHEAAVVGWALHAESFRPKRLVENGVATPVVLALNRSAIVVDEARLRAIIAHQREIADRALPVVQDGLQEGIPRLAVQAARWPTVSKDPVWMRTYDEWRRADVCLSRGVGLLKSLALADRFAQPSTFIVTRPTWRFHRHWWFAAAAPALHILPRELRDAVPALPGFVWVRLALDVPHVRQQIVNVVTWQPTLSPGTSITDAYARAMGFESTLAYEAVLKAQATEESRLALEEAIGEMLTWVLRTAWQWHRFGTAPMLAVRGDAYFQVPVDANLKAYVDHLHTTMVTTPTVLRWRDRGAMHWTVSAGRTWGAVHDLGDNAEHWGAALQLL